MPAKTKVDETEQSTDQTPEEPTPESRVIARYIGQGNYYVGVPARDLTEDELSKIGRKNDLLQKVEHGGYYQFPKSYTFKTEKPKRKGEE